LPLVLEEPVRRSGKMAAIALVVVWIASSGACRAIDITVTDIRPPIIDAGDLLGGAGTGFVDTYESATIQATITIRNSTGSSDTWRVDVLRTDANWHSDLALYVRRTGDGSGSGPIIGGAAYQQVGPSYGSFFSGAGDRTDIPIQVKLTGVSVHTAPGGYSTTVIYTVVDTL
jgi:hypothetical protein